MKPHYLFSFLLLCLAANGAFGQSFPESTDMDARALVKSEAQKYTSLMSALRKTSSDPNIDVKYYKLNLTITTAPNYLRGVVTMQALSLISNLTTVTLDLRNILIVDSVKMGDTSVSFAQDSVTLTITLNRSYGQGELVVVDIYYQGVPGPGCTFSSHQGTPWVYTYSNPYDAKDWWPSKDHPSDKADSVDMWVTVDSVYKVGSNGKLVAVIDNGNGTRTFKWAERYPITTYNVSLAITNYAEFTDWFKYTPTDSMPVLNYLLSEHFSTLRDSLTKTVDMLRIYSEKYGLYPFITEKYGQAEFGWTGSSMEHQTMTSLGSFREWIIAHELAHSWFGNMISTANWPCIWLNEGFAQYSAAVYFEAKYGTSSYWDYMNNWMSFALQAAGSLYIKDTLNVNVMFNMNLTYRKGATVLHMLRHVLGDSIFFRSIRAYANDPRFRFGVATIENFQHVCESVSGTQLAYFFNEWVYGEKYPKYKYSWSAIPDTNGGYILPIRIQQSTETTNPEFFRMPVDFRLTGSNLDTVVVLMDTLADQTFRIHVSQLPTTGELDPNKWILKSATLVSVKDDGLTHVPQAFGLEQNYPNPFNPTTVISYQSPVTSRIRLSVFDLLGREVAVLVNEGKPAGRYSVTWDASGFSSGIYFYQLRAGEYTQTRKLLLLK